MSDRTVNCLQCVYFFVTWEAARPRGCRALGFKCREVPSQAVRNASGEECRYFRRRDRNRDRG
ncbi:MAG TPA: hypothetical protein VK997_00520 [Deferrisomatales bacterium]|nr:hypothetical protein [Deferrisomatales bacterium]